jgi:hypothetical protein
MDECVDGSTSCSETTNNLLDFSVIEAYSSSGPKQLSWTAQQENGEMRSNKSIFDVLARLPLVRLLEDTAVIELLLTRPERKVER